MSKTTTLPKSASSGRKCILVLGMHRSGTSALTRVLSLLGATLPKNILGARSGNEKGHWEPERLITLHDEMLGEANSSWQDWRTFDPAVLGAMRVAHYKAEIIRLIREEYDDAALMIIKEPRICRFVPLYQEVFGSLNITPLYILPFRNPLAVVQSHATRDGLTASFASLIWLRHVLEAEKHTRGKPRAIISYEWLLSDWRGMVSEISYRLKLEWPIAAEKARKDVEEFLSRNLTHHASSLDELVVREDIAGWVKDAYQALINLEKDGVKKRTEATLDRIRNAFDAAAPIFGDAFFNELQATKREADALRRQMTEREAADCLREELTERDKTISSLRATISALQASTSWRVTWPLRLIKRLIRRPEYMIKRILGCLKRTIILLIGQRRANLLKSQIQRILSRSCAKSGSNIDHVPKLVERIDFSSSPLRVIAFYLPQFHPIPENDEWWGKGFAEWTNVSKTVSEFLGHYQPYLPRELGFYDLRIVDVMRQQVELAKLYGIGGFCFYHYWFGGKRLLERPFNQFLEAKDIDFPFCLCWANENWTRRWDGLIAQSHSPEDDIAFIKDLIPVLRDERYIRVEGRPVLLVYRVSLLPDAKATADRWRRTCIDAGVGNPYLVAVRSFGITDPRPFGFDAALEFPPHEKLADKFTRQESSQYPLIKTVMPGWDNEARRPGAGHTFFGASPASYAKWFHDIYAITMANIKARAGQPPFVFVNAWNEWAEGAHLEPDRKYGYAYLHATANVIRNFTESHPEVAAIVNDSQRSFIKRSDTAVIVHLHYDDLFPELLKFISNAHTADVFISLRSDISPESCLSISRSLPGARLAIFPNRGRDMYSFLQIHQFLAENGYEIGCKIHSKKSPHRPDGDALRRAAFMSLLGSRKNFDIIVRRMREEADLGILAPKGSLLYLGDTDRFMSNQAWLDKILEKVGCYEFIGNYRWRFVAGSMFWFRVSALNELQRLTLKLTDFEHEVGQLDGTLAHSLERVMTLFAQKSGFVVDELKN